MTIQRLGRKLQITQLNLHSKKSINDIEASFPAFIDPGSYSNDKISIVSYVSDNVYNKLMLNFNEHLIKLIYKQ